MLGRVGDAGGVAFWLTSLDDGVMVWEVLVEFANPPENVQRTATRPPISVVEGRVLRLYPAMLGREPDAGGLAFRIGRFNDGLSLPDMALEFTAQPEFEDFYEEDPTDEELVAAAHRKVLGRDGDEGGTAFWLEALATDLRVAELFASFSDSPENIERTGTAR